MTEAILRIGEPRIGADFGRFQIYPRLSAKSAVFESNPIETAHSRNTPPLKKDFIPRLVLLLYAPRKNRIVELSRSEEIVGWMEHNGVVSYTSNEDWRYTRLSGRVHTDPIDRGELGEWNRSWS